MQTVIDAADEPQVKAWLLSRKAAFQHLVDADGAQKTLAAAHHLEPMAIKPMHGIAYKKLTPEARQQAATLISNHSGRFLDPTDMKLFANGLCSDLQFIPETSRKFEAAINELAWFIGIRWQRPERDYGEGPDNLWALPNGSFLVIECKTVLLPKTVFRRKMPVNLVNQSLGLKAVIRPPYRSRSLFTSTVLLVRVPAPSRGCVQLIPQCWKN